MQNRESGKNADSMSMCEKTPFVDGGDINNESKPLMVAITGNIGSGKTTVAKIVSKCGYKVISADEKTEQSYIVAKTRLIETFGEKIFVGDELNRKELSSLVFNNSALREKLNEILHPIINQLVFREAADCQGVVFVEVPLLFECNMENSFDKVVLVISSYEDKIKRIMARDKLSFIEAEKRLNSQINDDVKIKKSHIIIKNNSDQIALENSVKDMLIEIEESFT